MNLPTEELMFQKTRPDLIGWKENCLRKAEEYKSKQPQSSFWESLTELMEMKADIIQDFLNNHPDHFMPTSTAGKTFLQANSPNPWRPTLQEVRRGDTGGTYHRTTERIPPPGKKWNWDERDRPLPLPVKKESPAEKRKRELEEASQELETLQKQNAEMKLRAQALIAKRRRLEKEEEEGTDQPLPQQPQTETEEEKEPEKD